MGLELLCKQTCALVKETAEFIRAEAGKITSSYIETKGLHDLVTFVDKLSEEKLIAGLSKLIPDAGFMAEESSSKNILLPLFSGEVESCKDRMGYNWIIDPLDGTTNFIHQIPCYAISVALMLDGKIILGVVYEIARDECFYAFENSSAYMNGVKIKVSETKVLHDSLLATGFPYNDFTSLENYIRLLTFFMKNTRGIRRIGSAATDLCYVACGRFDGFFEYALKPWDVAAGAFIAQQAGAKVCDFKGGNDFIFGKQVIVGNPFITESMLLSFKEYFS